MYIPQLETMSFDIVDIWDIFKAAIEYILRQFSEYTCKVKDDIIAGAILFFGICLLFCIVYMKFCCCCSTSTRYHAVSRNEIPRPE